MNRIILMGRLTRDPQLRQTDSGTAVCSLTLAVDRRGKERVTDFIDCVAWRQTAEFVKKYFFKGQMCLVEGRLQLRDWTDSDGHKRRNAEVQVDNVYFTGGKAESRGTEPETDAGLDDITDDEDELPF